MRIALLSSNFPPHFEGGTERVVRAQARELRALGHAPRVVAGTDAPHAGTDVLESEVDGLPVAHLPRTPGEHYDVDLRRPRVRALAAGLCGDAELVHVHHWAGFDLELVRALAPRAPVVVTFHDLFATCTRFFRSPVVEGVACPAPGEVEPCVACLRPDVPADRTDDELRAALGRRAEALAAEVRAAAALVAPSPTHAARVERLLELEPGSVRVVAHGLCWDLDRAPERPAPAPLPARFDRERPLRVLHFGHRSRVKGTLDLAAAMARQPAGAVELHLAGREVEPGLDRAVAELAGDAVSDHGPFAPADLPGLAARADLAAFPSRAEESYGLVVEEALALGLPVWVSDRGALPERLSTAPGAGRILPSADPTAWATALGRVLADPGELARERAAVPDELPTARDAARELDSLYRSLSRDAP